MIKYLYLLPASVILFWLFSLPPHTNLQGAVQQNTTYSCTVAFANQPTESVWVAMTEVKGLPNKRANQTITGITKSSDKRVADTACRDFFAERAKHQSPGEDTTLGK